MDIIVNTKGGYPGGRSSYFLNDEATADKLKKAATNFDLEVTHNSGSKTLNFSTGSYISTVLPLVKAWQDIEGGDIDLDQVDGMEVTVVKVKTVVDLGDTIEKYLVKLRVEGKLVTITMFDTTLSVLVQAGTMLEPYCARVLIPYLEKEVKRNVEMIQEINEKVLAIVVPKGTTRKQHREFMKEASMLELPPTPSPPWMRTPVTQGLAPAQPSPTQQPRPPPPSPIYTQEAITSYLALPPPVSPSRTPGVLARAPAPGFTQTQRNPQDPLEEAGPPIKEAGPPAEAAPDPQEIPYPLLTPAGILVMAQRQDVTEENVACFPCNMCETVCSSINCLRKHMEEVHDNTNKENEPESMKNFLLASGMQIQLSPNFENEHNKFRRTINLDNIEYTLSLTSNVESEESEHEVSNSDSKIVKVISLDQVDISSENEDSEDETFKCDMCQYEVSQEVALKIHKTREHKPKLKCQKCGYRTVSKVHLENHIKDQHERITACVVCGENVSDVASVQVHILTKHSTQSDQIVELLKKQELVISNMQQQIDQILGQMETNPQKNNANQANNNIPVPKQGVPDTQPPPSSEPPSYSAMVQSAASAPQQPQASMVPVRTISYVTDSIGGNVIFEELEKITKAKFKRRKAYGSVRATGQQHPDSNIMDVVPKELIENKPEVLVLQRDSITLTNLSPGAPDDYARQQVLLASYNMFTVATNALASNPNLQQVVLMEAVPRYDGKKELNEYGNQMLHQAKTESTSAHKAKVMIGVHSLECEGGLRASRYGDGRRGEVDLVHMRGTSGKVAFTRSVASILAGAGLTTPQDAAMVARNKAIQIRRSGGDGFRRSEGDGDRRSGGNGFRSQGRRSRGGPRQQGISTFQLATRNRFDGFQGNW